MKFFINKYHSHEITTYMGVMCKSTTTSVCDRHLSFCTWPGLCLEKKKQTTSVIPEQQSSSSWLQIKDDPCHTARDIITLLPVLLLAPLSLPSLLLLSSLCFAFIYLPMKSPQPKTLPLGSEKANIMPLGAFQAGSSGHISLWGHSQVPPGFPSAPSACQPGSR